MERKCLRCGIPLAAGNLRAVPDRISSLTFVLPGTPTSWNPITAFQQGLAGDTGERTFPLFAFRCPQCGYVELTAPEE